MASKSCPQCKNTLEKTKFGVGYGIEIDSLHCKQCGFTITENNTLAAAMDTLRERMSKEIKIIKVGTGLGVRFPNEIVKNYKLKKGEEIILQPDVDGLKLITAT
ncbi:MAG TPA: hypothetical protein VJC16_05765 [Candidatus Nanoarchaeia archaeon]|nr:hypothetical protein [Candidatus Nanoarchaeia archaeon]